jgi:hypothetical protein
MNSFFASFTSEDGFGSAALQTIFDAEQGTPELIDQVARQAPQIRDVMAGLRESLPLVPHSGIGPIGRFYRIPNHYRSVSFMLPPDHPGDQHPGPGVIVFKGTEPLLQDFPAYLEWMLGTPFRGSPLPLALHFPLDMRLPPAAMWIEECNAEQAVSSSIQQRYLGRHGRLARLPVPLFVFKMKPEMTRRYEDVIRSRISAEAVKKIGNKLADGLGVEVYYYPELPVRVADLFVGNVRNTFRDMLTAQDVERVFGDWASLLAEMLGLGYMPYAPWHHGMGACVDQGNTCIDGGFNDLLTLVPFEAIPDDALFRQSMLVTIRMLSESMAALAAASLGVPPVAESDASSLAATYLTERLRARLRALEDEHHGVDPRLGRFFASTTATDILNVLRAGRQGLPRQTQFMASRAPTAGVDRANIRVAAGA